MLVSRKRTAIYWPRRCTSSRDMRSLARKTRIRSRNSRSSRARRSLLLSSSANLIRKCFTSAEIEASRAATARERSYLAAVGTLFDAARPPWPERERAYARAMERMVAEYPQDREAAIFYALALNLTAPLGGIESASPSSCPPCG